MISQKVTTELPLVLQAKDNFTGNISTPGVIGAYLTMSYFTPISEFKVHNSLPENKYLT